MEYIVVNGRHLIVLGKYLTIQAPVWIVDEAPGSGVLTVNGRPLQVLGSQLVVQGQSWTSGE